MKRVGHNAFALFLIASLGCCSWLSATPLSPCAGDYSRAVSEYKEGRFRNALELLEPLPIKCEDVNITYMLMLSYAQLDSVAETRQLASSILKRQPPPDSRILAGVNRTLEWVEQKERHIAAKTLLEGSVTMSVDEDSGSEQIEDLVNLSMSGVQLRSLMKAAYNDVPFPGDIYTPGEEIKP